MLDDTYRPTDRRRAGASRHPAAWLADPAGRHEIRYWNGRAWTAHVSDGGIPATDPVVSGPGPAADLPVPRWIVAAPAGDRLLPSGASTGPRRRLWPGLIVAATLILVAVVVVGTGGTADPAAPANRVARRSTSGPTVATLPVSECQRIVLEVQAGMRAMTVADYRRACGALPAGVVLGPAATTTAVGTSEVARRP